MSRPAQVQKMVDRVAELQAQIAGEDDTPPKQEAPVPPTPTPVEEPVQTVSKKDHDQLEQRYRTLQGMYNADTTRLRKDLADAIAANQALGARVSALETQTKPTPTATPERYVTDKDEEEFGDTLDVMRRAAREEASAYKAEIASLRETVAELSNKLGQVSSVVPQIERINADSEAERKSRFWNAVNTEVPDWQEINTQEPFHEWLLEVDALTNLPRQHFLSEARAQYDAPRVIRFFQEWKRIVAGAATPAPQTQPKKAVSELEAQISPGASRGASAQVGEPPKIYTRGEIGQFYADVTAGKYRGKETEKARIEADIYLAQREGRVTL